MAQFAEGLLSAQERLGSNPVIGKILMSSSMSVDSIKNSKDEENKPTEGGEDPFKKNLVGAQDCRLCFTDQVLLLRNKLLLIGSFTSYNGTLSNGTIVLNSDGTIYQTFSTKYQGVFFIGSKLFGQPTSLPIELIATYP